jgi:phosphatidylinositol alpha-mannosyltransferase
MRIALVCPYDLDTPGGVQDQVFRLERWLSEAGHDPFIVGPGEGGGPTPNGVVVVGGSMVVRANRSAAPIAIDPRVAGRVRDAVADADVLHVHEPFMPIVSLAATRIRTIPSVGTFHADAAPWARTALRVASPLAKVVAARLDVMTAVSGVARSAIQSIDDVRIIPNGIDVDDYAAGDKDPGTVVFVGRDDPRKGLDILLEAWERIAAAHPTAHLDIVGAERDDAIAGVTFHGRVDEARKRALLGRASIAVAPNLGGESFGIVVTEAMASGCAVVASALPAFTAVLGDAGEFVRPGDADGLADRVITLLADPARISQRSAEATARVRRFDGRSVARAYLEAYDDAIAIHGG